MNLIKVNIPFFKGSANAHTACKLLNMCDELGEFITGTEEFKGYKKDGYVQIEMYSPITEDTRALFHFKEGEHIDTREFYAALVITICDQFAEVLI